jgi:hypothetical protein
MKSIRHADIEVPLPAHWNDSTQIVVVGPAQDGFRPNLVVAPSRPFASAEAWAKEFCEGLKNISGAVLKSHAAATIGAMSGHLVELTAPVASKTAGQMVFWVTSGGRSFTITYTDTPEKIADRANALKLIGLVRIGSRGSMDGGSFGA